MKTGLFTLCVQEKVAVKKNKKHSDVKQHKWGISLD